MNYAHIVLIPKKEGEDKMGDFRPICLLNGLFKNIIKVLIDRPRGVIDEMIDPQQIGFTKDCFNVWHMV